MKKIKLEEVKAYEAPGHFGMTAMRLQGTEETGITKFWMGLSHFLPNGGAEWGYEDNPLEKVYFVLERFGGHDASEVKSLLLAPIIAAILITEIDVQVIQLHPALTQLLLCG